MIAGQPVVVGNTRAIVADAPGTEWARVRLIDEDGTVSDEVLALPFDRVSTVECSWFALCDHEATSLEAHPALNAVPICDRCKAKVDRLRDARG